MPATLYLVATPIGNLADISKRALDTLQTVDLIACEDTRHTGRLLNHFNIKKKLVSYHEHNEQTRTEELAEFLKQGKSVAVVSDAGTPAISDPALKIVRKAHEIGATVTAIPGAVAFVNALIVSGLPTDSCFFGGFLPSKKNRKAQASGGSLKDSRHASFYETPHRLAKSLIDCLEILGNRKAAVVREITKLHEEIVLGSLQELTGKFSAGDVKGEIVLVIDREQIANRQSPIANEKSLPERVAELEKEGIDRKLALKKAAKEFGLSRSEAYRIWQMGKK